MPEINKLQIDFRDFNGKTVLRKKLTGLPLKEKSILAKSIEWFNDPEPCMIHRSAVMKRIYLEYFEYFRELLKSGTHEQALADIPGHLLHMLDVRDEISAIKLELNE